MLQKEDINYYVFIPVWYFSVLSEVATTPDDAWALYRSDSHL